MVPLNPVPSAIAESMRIGNSIGAGISMGVPVECAMTINVIAATGDAVQTIQVMTSLARTLSSRRPLGSAAVARTVTGRSARSVRR